MIREICKEDLPFVIDCLSFLSHSPFETSQEIYQVEKALEERSICGNIFTFVYVDDDTKYILGTISVKTERKLSHGGGLTASIQDVAVNKLYTHTKGIGTKMVNFAIEFAKSLGAYKITLECKKELLGFYERFGFQASGYEMRINCNESKPS